MKGSAEGRITMQKIRIGKFSFDEKKTKAFREKLPDNKRGIVLKRKFEKEINETYPYDYIYSAWLFCEKKEVEEEVEIKLDLPFDPLFMDWLGKEKKSLKGDKFKISSTPIFLLGNDENNKSEGSNGFATFCIVLVCIIGICIILIGGLYVFKKYIKKTNRQVDQGFFDYLNPISL